MDTHEERARELLRPILNGVGAEPTNSDIAQAATLLSTLDAQARAEQRERIAELERERDELRAAAQALLDHLVGMQRLAEIAITPPGWSDKRIASTFIERVDGSEQRRVEADMRAALERTK